MNSEWLRGQLAKVDADIKRYPDFVQKDAGLNQVSQTSKVDNNIHPIIKDSDKD